jgi:hypothetical protein
MTSTAPQGHSERILEICHASQEATDRKKQTYGDDREAVKRILAESEPYSTFWKGYRDGIEGRVKIQNASFKDCLFSWAHFKDHEFLACDFSGSRWIFASLKDSDCSGSNFSNLKTFAMGMTSTNCSGCSFRDSTLDGFAFFYGNDYSGADFTGARLENFHSAVDESTLGSISRFNGANMTGCRLVLKKEKAAKFNKTPAQLRALLEKMFTPEQLAVMEVDYGTGSIHRLTNSSAKPSQGKRLALLLLLLGVFVLAAYLFTSSR